MVSLTRQDVQSVVDNARTRMLDQVASRQDIQLVRDNLRSITTMIQQTQQMLRQEEFQRVQLVRRSVLMEARMSQLEHELQGIKRSLETITASQQAMPKVTERVIAARTQDLRSGRGYAYSPNPS